MDKNTYTGFILIVLIMIGSYFYLRPSAAQLKKEQQLQDSIKRAATVKATAAPLKTDTVKKVVSAVADSALLKTPFGIATVGTEKLVTLENQELRIKLSTHGGRISSVELKNYKTFDKKPLILFDGDKNQFGFPLNVPGKALNTKDLYFTPSGGDLTVAEKDSSTDRKSVV